MRISCVSDLHGHLPPPETFEGVDLLLIAGDICPATDHSIPFQIAWLDDVFRRWLDILPVKHVVGCAGNHDFVFEQSTGIRELARRWKWHYLQDEAIVIEGIKIWGSPWQPFFFQWAFNAPQKDGEVFLDEIYSKIPKDTDIVISHGPPAHCGNVDLVPSNLKGSPNAGEHVGSLALYKHLNRVKVKLCVCGHIHAGRLHSPVQIGWLSSQNAMSERLGAVVNASYIDERYVPSYPPLVFEWEKLLKGYNPSEEDFEDFYDDSYKAAFFGGYAYMHDTTYLTDEKIEERKKNGK